MAGMASMLLLAVLPAADAALTRGWKRAPTGAVVRSRLQGLRATAVAPSDAPVVPSEVVRTAVAALQPVFADIDMRTEHHLRRLLAVFRKHNVGPHLFAGVDGYGNGDLGREALDGIYAELMGAEAALVRVQIFSGTHAIACALFGVLRPGDEMLTVSGAPSLGHGSGVGGGWVGGGGGVVGGAGEEERRRTAFRTLLSAPRRRPHPRAPPIRSAIPRPPDPDSHTHTNPQAGTLPHCHLQAHHTTHSRKSSAFVAALPMASEALSSTLAQPTPRST